MAYVLSIPIILIFVVFILPIWLWLHYSKKGNGQSQLTDNEVRKLIQLAEQAQQMQQRIKTLEEILDAEHPNWR